MRKSTMLWLLLAAVCGALLFRTSQTARADRATLDRLTAGIAKEEESLRVLRAEWSYLNQPERLERLARAHLKLEPMKARQFAKIDDIPLKEPAPPAADNVLAAGAP